MPLKTCNIPKHERSPPWPQTKFGFNPEVAPGVRSAYSKPGRQHGPCSFKCQVLGLVQASLPVPPTSWGSPVILSGMHPSVGAREVMDGWWDWLQDCVERCRALPGHNMGSIRPQPGCPRAALAGRSLKRLSASPLPSWGCLPPGAVTAVLYLREACGRGNRIC